MTRRFFLCTGRWALLAVLGLALSITLAGSSPEGPAGAQEPGEGPSISSRVLRRGSLIEALQSAAQEERADAIAFGRPQGAESSFSLTGLEKMGTTITQNTGIETSIL